MLVHSISPKLMRKRLLPMKRKSLEFTVPSFHSGRNSESSSSSSPSSSFSTFSSPTIPPILIFSDGDYPQTMALFNGVLESLSNDNISVIKCPRGTSRISQPNDLMKWHMIFRQATTHPNYWNKFASKEYVLPEYWTDLLLPYFKVSGVSAAFQDTYGFFFSTLSSLISKSFTVDIVKKGDFNYHCASSFNRMI